MKSRGIVFIVLSIALSLVVSSCDLFGLLGVKLEVSGGSTHYSDEMVYVDAVLYGVDPADYVNYGFTWYLDGVPQTTDDPSVVYWRLVASDSATQTLKVEVESPKGSVKSASVKITVQGSGSLRIVNNYSYNIDRVLDGASDLLGSAYIPNDGTRYVILNMNGTKASIRLEAANAHSVTATNVTFPYAIPQRLTLNADGTLSGPSADTTPLASAATSQGSIWSSIGHPRQVQFYAPISANR